MGWCDDASLLACVCFCAVLPQSTSSAEYLPQLVSELPLGSEQYYYRPGQSDLHQRTTAPCDEWICELGEFMTLCVCMWGGGGEWVLVIEASSTLVQPEL